VAVAVTRSPCVLNRDDVGRLHCDDGPAIAWSDGDTRFYWHGVVVPRKLIESPDSITVRDIQGEENAEVKRCMLERFGLARYLDAAGARHIQTDSYGELWGIGGERYVVVKNPTPSPDGTRRTYVLGVPRECRTAHEAVAATWRLRAEDFDPSSRS